MAPLTPCQFISADYCTYARSNETVDLVYRFCFRLVWPDGWCECQYKNKHGNKKEPKHLVQLICSYIVSDVVHDGGISGAILVRTKSERALTSIRKTFCRQYHCLQMQSRQIYVFERERSKCLPLQKYWPFLFICLPQGQPRILFE